jgi:multiple sugar transport system permease protein
MNVQNRWRGYRKNLTGLIFVAPCVIILALMMINPLIETVKFSVSQIRLPRFETDFIGFDNYLRVIFSRDFWVVVQNTVKFVVGLVFLRFLLAFWGALTLNAKKLRGNGVLRLLILLPWTVPSIVASNLWRWIFQADFGLLNLTLKQWGLQSWTHSWLADSGTALYAVIVAYAWSGFPFVMMMLLAGMQSIPLELYDAGKVDGANHWQLFRYITIPSIKPIIIIILLLEIIGALNAFDMLFVMTGGGPGGATETLGLFIYRLGFRYYDFAGASATSVVLLLASFSCFLLYMPFQVIRKSIQHKG